MNKKKCFLLILLCFGLCACQKPVPEDETNLKEIEVSISQEDELPEPEAGMGFLDQYDALCIKENVKRVSYRFYECDKGRNVIYRRIWGDNI